MSIFAFLKKKSKEEAPIRMLQTERLVLRGFKYSDAVDVFAYAQSEKVGPMAGWAPHKTIQDSQEQVRRFSQRRDVWAMVEKKTGRVIGSIGLHRDRKRDATGPLMMGFSLGEAWWGQGYATEAARELLRYAFMELNAPIVSAYHFVGNSKSKRVIKKLGMTYEGTLRMASLLADGSLSNDCCYSITRKEYMDGKAAEAKPKAAK